MSKKIKGSYLLNAVGVTLVFALLTGLFAANAFGTSTTYVQGICTTACYTIIMVTSLNLVVGFMGEFSLGHAGFVSVGAYVSAIVSGALAGKGLSDLGLFLIALLVGGLAAGIMGVLVGIPALRLRGDYLAIVTMAFAEIIRVCFCNFSITGGGKTMSGILKLSTFPRVFWIMVVCVTIMYLFVRSKYGRTVQAIREDYIAASASGINVTYYKVMTFAISAFFAGIGGGIDGSGSNVTVSGAAQVTVTASKSNAWDSADTGATIGNGGSVTEDNDLVDGKEIQADISRVTTGYIHHIIYNPDGTIKREWWEPERRQPTPENPQPDPEDPNAPAEETNEVSLGTPLLHVETLEGVLLPFDAQQQGSTLRVTTDNLAARLHGTRQALEALREQGVEQIQFVTSLKTTTLPMEDLLAEGGSWFALEHDGLVSRRLSAAQAESLKCWMH